MSFDIPQMHIPDDSKEALVLDAIMSRDKVSVEEAVRRAIRAVDVQPRKPAAKASGIRRVFTEADLETLRKSVPLFAFLENLPDDVIDGIEAATKHTRAQRFNTSG